MLYSIDKNSCHYLLSFVCNKFLKMHVANQKTPLRHCNYDSAIKFELEGVGINTIILF